MTDKEYLQEISKDLDNAKRLGSPIYNREAFCVVEISDILARQISKRLLEISDRMP